MAMPSRKRLAVYILLGFLIAFFAAIILYLAPLLFGDIEYDAQGNPVRDVSLFPFGNGTDPGSPIDDIIEPDDNNGDNNNVVDNNLDRQDQFRLIDAGPVIGAVMYNAPGHDDDIAGIAPATSTDSDVENTFRFIRLGTGHVFEGSTDSGKIERISNTTIPRIAEAEFVSPERIIMRYPDDSNRIKTFSAELVRNFVSGNNGTPFKLQGIFLQDDILDIDVSDSDNLLQLVSVNDGVNRSSVVVTDEIGGNPRQVLASPFSEWLVSWNNAEPVALLQSRASYNTFGGAYTLDTQTGAFTPYIDARKGLQVLPTNNYSQALVSENADGATKLYVWNRNENQYIDLGLSTFAHKCVWAENRARFYCAVPVESIAQAEPDLWFQGVTQYSDQIWEIEPVTGQSRILVLPLQYTQDALDMVDLNISPDGQFLYFRDKIKRSLWSYHLDYNIVGSAQDESSRTPARLQTNTFIGAETNVETVATPTDTFFE